MRLQMEFLLHSEEIKIKLLVAQLLMIAVIWAGMAFFFGDMGAVGKYVFYLVTSWLLFLLVIVLKTLYKNRKSQRNNA